MALLSGVHVVWVSLLNGLPYYILENNARYVNSLRWLHIMHSSLPEMDVIFDYNDSTVSQPARMNLAQN